MVSLIGDKVSIVQGNRIMPNKRLIQLTTSRKKTIA